jgi:hypothetical protein
VASLRQRVRLLALVGFGLACAIAGAIALAGCGSPTCSGSYQESADGSEFIYTVNTSLTGPDHVTIAGTGLEAYNVVASFDIGSGSTGFTEDVPYSSSVPNPSVITITQSGGQTAHCTIYEGPGAAG